MKPKKGALLDVVDNLSFKEVEDLFKIAFRNYVDLVTVADRKAGLMIQVNSIIVSVVIAFTLRHVDGHPMYLVPLLMLLLVALMTIYFAIKASKPQEKVQKNNSLHVNEKFFFGSFDRVDNGFIRMEWEDYKSKLLDLLNGEKSKVLEQIMKETFMVRKVLAQKFKFISIAYKVFKYGSVLTITCFLAVYFLEA